VCHGHRDMTWLHLFSPPVVWITVYHTFLESVTFPSLGDHAYQFCNEERKQGAKCKTCWFQTCHLELEISLKMSSFRVV